MQALSGKCTETLNIKYGPRNYKGKISINETTKVRLECK